MKVSLAYLGILLITSILAKTSVASPWDPPDRRANNEESPKVQKEKDYNPIYKNLHASVLEPGTGTSTRDVGGPSNLIKPGPVYSTQVQINGISYWGSLDDGAQVTRINKTWAAQHGIVPIERSIETIVMADCKPHDETFEISQELEFGNK
ncbi:hypothetical protein HDU79_009938 [Rhizoclosmatium sp. JEL0117]|nr:hypothetical protein HDU79_009938 [Rhizoclosmatium sp. JEL0117]